MVGPLATWSSLHNEVHSLSEMCITVRPDRQILFWSDEISEVQEEVL